VPHSKSSAHSHVLEHDVFDEAMRKSAQFRDKHRCVLPNLILRRRKASLSRVSASSHECGHMRCKIACMHFFFLACF
jgi:hypothetical protein